MDKLILRKMDYAKDLLVLYQYMMDEDSQCLLSEQFEVNTIQMFERWLNHRFEMGIYHDFFMVETSNGQTIGFTFSYDFLISNGHCKYTLCLFREYQKTGFGAAAAIRMMGHLFKVYPLRQIYISVYDYNTDSLSANLKGGFEEIGRYPEHRFFDGVYYDLHILRMTREQFDFLYKKVR